MNKDIKKIEGILNEFSRWYCRKYQTIHKENLSGPAYLTKKHLSLAEITDEINEFMEQDKFDKRGGKETYE